MTPRMTWRASFACCSAAASTSDGMPLSLVSSWSAVTNSGVPATLKSMSPNASSAPRMSVSVTYWVLPSTSSEMSPIAMPATGAFSGTPAESRPSVEAQTEPIEVEPLEPSASDTCRMAYGNSSRDGSTGISARSARAPWPISRRFGEPTRPVSPVEYGGKL
ncbi:hypothetical protein GUI43_04953 [Micromonospora noduli]|nr:hypothetical protein GUI43_04953 [Micromonospora noduli]RAO51953.1 hypothetical protein ONO86_01943 [Micromonospora noduli]